MRDGSFNPRANSVAIFKLLGVLTLTGELNGLKLGLWTHHELTGIGESGGTLTAARTGQTVLLAKLDANDLRDGAILLDRPLPTRVALRTGGTLGLPINAKAGMIKALTRMSLPTRATCNWPKQLDPIGVSISNPAFCTLRIHRIGYADPR